MTVFEVARLTTFGFRELLDGLRGSGFRLNFGDDGSGFLMKAWERGGGYYLGIPNSHNEFETSHISLMLDVGASKLSIEGKIKLKNDSLISHFTNDCIVFEDGSELPADVVMFATG